METLKITQALSEIKLAEKKIASSLTFVLKNAKRDERLRDPFEKDKTTQEAMVKAELQSIADNEKRVVSLRMAINKANLENSITIEGQTKTIAEWIIWKRDILPRLQDRLERMNKELVVSPKVTTSAELWQREVNRQAPEVVNHVFNISEKKLLEEIQLVQSIEEKLDGMLSLSNANIDVTI